MNFNLSPEQQQLQQSVARFIQREYSAEQRQQLLDSVLNGDFDSNTGFSEDSWQRYAELGWLGLIVDERYQGIGGSAVELMVLSEQFGKGLVLEPYLPVMLATSIIADSEKQALAVDVIPGIISGEVRAAAALYETQSRFDVTHIATKAERSDNGFVLEGSKTLVLAGQSAHTFVVSAILTDSDGQEQFALFIVDAQDAGLTLKNYSTIDGLQASELTLNQVEISDQALIAKGEKAVASVSAAIDAVLIGYAAEALGAMDTVLAMTVEYAKQRQQFGQSISRFQAVQHALADMYIACESIRSLLYAAAIKHSESAVDAERAVSALKYKVAKVGRSLSEKAVQLHGAMGFTNELVLSQYYKRLICISALFGDADHYLKRFAALEAAD